MTPGNVGSSKTPNQLPNTKANKSQEQQEAQSPTSGKGATGSDVGPRGDDMKMEGKQPEDKKSPSSGKKVVVPQLKTTEKKAKPPASGVDGARETGGQEGGQLGPRSAA